MADFLLDEAITCSTSLSIKTLVAMPGLLDIRKVAVRERFRAIYVGLRGRDEAVYYADLCQKKTDGDSQLAEAV